MADATDPNTPQTEAEKAYQANLAAARERLLAVEAAMEAQSPAQPNIQSAPPVAPPTPQPVQPTAPTPPAGFSLSSLKNPTQPTSPLNQPVPDVSALIAAHKSVSPLSDKKTEHQPPTPSPVAHNPLQTAQPPTNPAGHLQPIKPPQKPRSMPSRLKPLISAVIVFLVILAAFKAPIFYYQLRYLFTSQDTTNQDTNSASAQISTTPMLNIPKIHVSTPIVFEPSIQEVDVQKALESGVVHYGNTANPGEPGNSVIFGHSSNDWDKPGNYKFIFVLLEKLAVGDTYSIDYKGVRYEYQIYDRRVILATDVGVVAPTAETTSTLITCWPTGTTQKRLIVRGKQTSPEPKSNSNVAQLPTLNQKTNVLPGTDSNNGVVGTVTTWIENIRSAIKGETIKVNGQ